MVGGVISDIYHTHDRNTPMALFSAAALFGTGLAPLISGVIVTRTSWRWLFYSHAIVSAAFVLMIFFFFKETRGSVLLSRKAHKLNKYYEQLEKAGHHGVILSSEESPDEKCIRRIRWKVKSDEERASLLSMIKISLYRPFRKSIRFLTHDTTNASQICSSPNQWSFSSPCGYLSAGQSSTCSSVLCHSSSVPITTSTQSRQAPFSLRCASV